jgi:hypothetical protein
MFRNPNQCNWSAARKKIGPVNHPRDRLIDVISIALLFFFGDVTISRSTADKIGGRHGCRTAEKIQWLARRLE